MGLFGLFKKKKEEPGKSDSEVIERFEKRHIDDLDIPPIPSEEKLKTTSEKIPIPEDLPEELSREEGREIPQDIPPIEEVPGFEEEGTLPLPKKPEHELEEKQEIQETKEIKGPLEETEIPETPKIISPFKKPEAVSTEKTIFVRLPEFKKLLSEISVLRNQLMNSSKTLTRLKDVKNPEDSEFNKWKETIEDIERKLLYMDKTIFER